jgi:transcriptional regulator with PAS, ATPase and Fis domain
MDVTRHLVGVSDATKALQQELEEAARSDAKVLITGESGVGKEIAGQMIHHRSPRRHGPLVTINCAGMPDSLLESELFGHVRGSFTDAYRDKRGWLEQADGGTIFMDEVGEMSLRMQALLLRFLETGEIQRIGSDRACTRVDVRVVAATNRRLLDRIAANEFREDLYYRLDVIHIVVPPLRDRREDVPALVNHFLEMYTKSHNVRPMQAAPESLAALQAYHWPGNVRELKNVIERIVVRGRKPVIALDDLPPEILLWAGNKPAPAAPAAPPQPDRVAMMFDRIVKGGEDFWTAIHEPFMARDLTREELRSIVCTGLTHTKGSYRLLVDMFNMPQSDYRRFLNFLRKYDCNMPFQRFRMLSSPTQGTQPRPAVSGGRSLDVA